MTSLLGANPYVKGGLTAQGGILFRPPYPGPSNYLRSFLFLYNYSK